MNNNDFRAKDLKRDETSGHRELHSLLISWYQSWRCRPSHGSGVMLPYWREKKRKTALQKVDRARCLVKAERRSRTVLVPGSGEVTRSSP